MSNEIQKHPRCAHVKCSRDLRYWGAMVVNLAETDKLIGKVGEHQIQVCSRYCMSKMQADL